MKTKFLIQLGRWLISRKIGHHICMKMFWLVQKKWYGKMALLPCLHTLIIILVQSPLPWTKWQNFSTTGHGDKPPIGMNMYQTIFTLFAQLLMCCAKLYSCIQIFVTVHAQSWHQLDHMSFYIKYSATHAKVRHMFCYGTEGQPEGLGTATMSCMAIYGIKRFNFKVACLLHTLLSKNLLMLWTFPFA